MRNQILDAVRFLLCAIVAGAFVGCKSESESLPSTSVQVPPKASDIPLRITWVAPVSDVGSLTRQWLSNSEQPIAITSVTIDEFLGGQKVDSDIVLYPSSLLGELVERNWVVKLPGFVAEDPDETGDSGEAIGQRQPLADMPQAWRAAARYAGEDYAVPLGISIPVIIASNAFLQSAASTSSMDWEALLEANAKNEDSSVDGSEAATVVADPIAVVDRFLAVLLSITERNLRYGLLFDIKTMQPRLEEAKFVRAAEILRQLSLQPGGLSSVIGTHDQAWGWAATHDQPVIAIASPTALSAETAKIETGGMYEMDGYAFCNSGGGFLASLTSDCRQTKQSVLFLRWLRTSETRNFLAPIVTGIDSPTFGGVESLAYRVRQQLREPSNSDQLSQEPRLPGAHQYRLELGRELVAFLRGEKSAADALQSATESWNAAAAKDTRKTVEQRKEDYQQSLGLSQ